MSELFKICIHHGQLESKDIGLHSHAQRKKIRLYCRICQRIRDSDRREFIRKIKEQKSLAPTQNHHKNCYIHGDLMAKNIYIDTKGYAGCKLCKTESRRVSDVKWRTPEKERESNIKRTYGISLQQYNEMNESQGGLCAICKNPETLMRRDKIPPLSIDHCHKREKEGVMLIRGLLCKKCNSAISLMKDDPEILKNAVLYLEKYQ